MTLRELYTNKNNKTVISFEVFPPKEDNDKVKLKKLLNNLEILKKYNPAFISLTCGAGGKTETNTFEIIESIQDLGLEVMPHFTCVCTSKKQVKDYLKNLEKLQINDILALRGDIPEGVNFKNLDFKWANELVDFIKKETSLHIGVAGYPEGHIDCETLEIDLNNLKRKVDAGADVIYTQLFFDNNKYWHFVESARQIGIEVPIIPGVLPVTSYNQLGRMLSMARVTLPDSLMYRLEKNKDNNESVKKIGIEYATRQCEKLIASGVEGLHFYTLNASCSVSQVLDNLKEINLLKI